MSLRLRLRPTTPALAHLLPLSLLLLSRAASAQVAGQIEELPPPTEARPTEAPAAAAPDAAAPDAADAPAFRRRLFVSAVGGVGFAAVKHSDLATPKVYGPMLGLTLGYEISPRLSVGIEYTNLERVVSRDTAGERFAAASSWLHTQAKCNGCKLSNPGGPPLSWNMLLNVVGPKVEFSPFGRNGVYLGATGGLAILTLVDPRIGAGGTARLGARYTFADIVTIGAEGGVQGQAYSGSSVAVAFGAVSLRFAMIEPKKSRPAPKPLPQGLQGLPTTPQSVPLPRGR